jgi:hypothetical protein
MTKLTPSAPMQSLIADLHKVMNEQDAQQPGRRRRRRFVVWASAGAMLIGAPAIAMGTGVIDAGEDTLPDGSTFSHTVTTHIVSGAPSMPTKTESCDLTTIESPNGGAIAGNGCGPSGAQTSDIVTVTSVVGEADDAVLVSGIVDPAVGSLNFAASDDPDPPRHVALKPRPDDARRSFVFVASRRGGTLIGLDAAGDEAGRTIVPSLPQRTAALFPSLHEKP